MPRNPKRPPDPQPVVWKSYCVRHRIFLRDGTVSAHVAMHGFKCRIIRKAMNER